MELKRIAYCEQLRRDNLGEIFKAKRNLIIQDGQGLFSSIKKSQDSEDAISASTNSEDAVRGSYKAINTLYNFKENIELALQQGKVTEILSIVQSLRIFLQEEEDNSLFQKFINTELLQLVLPFLNYKNNVFGELIHETQLIIGTLSMGNETIVRTIIQEGYLRRIKIAFIESIIYRNEFNTIVSTLANMAGTGKPGGQIIELMDVSGVLELVVQEAKRYQSDMQLCDNLIWLFSNLLRSITCFREDKVKAFVGQMFYCINSVGQPTPKMIANTIWGTALFLESKPNSDDGILYLKNLHVLKDVITHFLTDFPPELFPPYSRIISRVTFHFEVCEEFITRDFCEVDTLN